MEPSRHIGDDVDEGDAAFRHVTDKTAKSLEDGWRWLMTDGLKAYLEAA